MNPAHWLHASEARIWTNLEKLAPEGLCTLAANGLDRAEGA